MTYEDVLNTDQTNVGYIVAEFSDSLFPSDNMYTIGDSTGQPNDRDHYVNGPLRYGSSFTFFLRAYPLLVSIISQLTITEYLYSHQSMEE